MTTPAPLLAVAFGIWEMLLLFGILMMLFGAKKLPQLAKGLGSGIRNFKGEIQAPKDGEEAEDTEEVRTERD